jgi:hypothetical protein
MSAGTDPADYSGYSVITLENQLCVTHCDNKKNIAGVSLSINILPFRNNLHTGYLGKGDKFSRSGIFKKKRSF